MLANCNELLISNSYGYAFNFVYIFCGFSLLIFVKLANSLVSFTYWKSLSSQKLSASSFKVGIFCFSAYFDIWTFVILKFIFSTAVCLFVSSLVILAFAIIPLSPKKTFILMLAIIINITMVTTSATNVIPLFLLFFIIFLLSFLIYYIFYLLSCYNPINISIIHADICPRRMCYGYGWTFNW